MKKKILIPILFLAGFYAIYELSKEHPNIYVTCIAVVLLMYGMMQLSAKTPSKNQEKEDDNV